MQTISTIAVTLIAVAALAGCNQSQSADPPAQVEAAASAPSPRPAGIDWFEGSVDAAFAKARQEDKPVLLYWGAVWCPSCNELKAKVFSKPEFIAKTKRLVPVYLDGDDPSAQQWSEVFDVRGNPTVLVLRADRSEVVRLDGGTDLNRYAAALDAALGGMQLIEAMVASMEGSAVPLSIDDCRRLAHSAFLAYRQALEGSADKLQSIDLPRIIERCPPEVRIERARLTAIHAASIGMKEGKDALNGEKPASPRLKAAARDLLRMMEDRKLVSAVADITVLDENMFDMAERLGVVEKAELRALRQRWAEALEAEADDPDLPVAQRLQAFQRKLIRTMEAQYKKTPGSKDLVPQPLADDARRRVEAVLAATYSAPERVGVVGAALSILYLLNEKDRAKAIIEKEIATAAAPYYYMSKMAHHHESLGDKETAIEWYRRAYREAKGPATRFEWGLDYVNALIRLSPQNEAAVRDAAIEVLGELDAPKGIYGRTRDQLDALEASLRKWSSNGQHAPAVAAIRGRMDDICKQVPSTEASSRKLCTMFLTEQTA